MTSRQVLLSTIALACLCTCATAQTAMDEFERGNTSYREGRFDQAAAAYETILKQGTASPAIYFNLGNNFFKYSQPDGSKCIENVVY